MAQFQFPAHARQLIRDALSKNGGREVTICIQCASSDTPLHEGACKQCAGTLVTLSADERFSGCEGQALVCVKRGAVSNGKLSAGSVCGHVLLDALQYAIAKHKLGGQLLAGECLSVEQQRALRVNPHQLIFLQ